jgi:hypothetical protein
MPLIASGHLPFIGGGLRKRPVIFRKPPQAQSSPSH